MKLINLALALAFLLQGTVVVSAHFDRTKFSGSEECKNFLDTLEFLEVYSLVFPDRLEVHRIQEGCIEVTTYTETRLASSAKHCPNQSTIKMAKILEPPFFSDKKPALKLLTETSAPKNLTKFLPCKDFADYERD